MDNLLISVLGNRDSGKSFTWNALFNRTVKTGKYERRLYFNQHEYVNVFLVSGSPEEREEYVGDIISITNPRIVLCSAQYVEAVKTTFEFFRKNGYFMFIQWLNPGFCDSGTEYRDVLDLTNWLSSHKSIVHVRSGKNDANPRVDEIKEYLYKWAIAQNLILRE